jgi:translation initiation factor 6 (eIF-6)
VEVDGILKADTVNQNIKIVKDGQETIVGEYTTGIEIGNISKLFE